MQENTTSMPLIGDKFPEIEVQTTHGRLALPSHFSGKWFILFSHPADFTPVCTTEFVSFAKKLPEFEALGCKLIGLSIDQVFSHIKWTEWIGEKLGVDIPFPIIADHGAVAARFGMVHPNKGSYTVRAVFVVDPHHLIRAIVYYPQELGRNMSEILRMVRALQFADREKVAMPANWPENELVGESVIIPPPTDIESAKKRKGQYECYDWWFCHKKI